MSDEQNIVDQQNNDNINMDEKYLLEQNGDGTVTQLQESTFEVRHTEISEIKLEMTEEI